VGDPDTRGEPRATENRESEKPADPPTYLPNPLQNALQVGSLQKSQKETLTQLIAA
jgi:hypothetical protein